MAFIYFLAIALFLVLASVLCFFILIQESKSTGLGASFGGDVGDSVFGTSTADILKRVTAWLAFFFLLSCVLLSLWTAALGHNKSQDLKAEISEYPQ